MTEGLESRRYKRTSPFYKFEMEDDAVFKKASIMKDVHFEEDAVRIHSGKDSDLNQREKCTCPKLLSNKLNFVTDSQHRVYCLSLKWRKSLGVNGGSYQKMLVRLIATTYLVQCWK